MADPANSNANRKTTRTAILSIVILVGVMGMPLAAGAASEPSYDIPIYGSWTDPQIDIVVVPNAVFPAVNMDPSKDQKIFIGDFWVDLDESPVLTPAGTGVGAGSAYVQAVRDGVAAWNAAIDAHVAAQPDDAHLSALQLGVTVLGDDATLEDLEAADVQFVFGVTEGPQVGVSTMRVNQRTGTMHNCVIRVSQAEPMPFAVNDVYNIATHEIGHCLGLKHPSDPSTDLMEGLYGRNVGYLSTGRACISNLDTEGLAVAYDWLRTGTHAPPPSFEAHVAFTDYALFQTESDRPACDEQLRF